VRRNGDVREESEMRKREEKVEYLRSTLSTKAFYFFGLYLTIEGAFAWCHCVRKPSYHDVALDLSSTPQYYGDSSTLFQSIGSLLDDTEGLPSDDEWIS